MDADRYDRSHTNAESKKAPTGCRGFLVFNPLFQWYLHQRQVVLLEFV